MHYERVQSPNDLICSTKDKCAWAHMLSSEDSIWLKTLSAIWLSLAATPCCASVGCMPASLSVHAKRTVISHPFAFLHLRRASRHRFAVRRVHQHHGAPTC